MTEYAGHAFVEPARVHIVSSDVPLGHHPEPRRPRRGLSARSFVLTSNDPVQQILPLNTHRCEAWIQPLTNAITVYASRADAQAGGNGGITIPAGNTMPFPLHTTDPVWATAATLPTTVSVMAIIED